jgi:hypothetical protein
LKSGDGYSELELAEAEKRLGSPIPSTLREAYALFGKRSELIGVVDPLNNPEELYIERPGNLGNPHTMAFLIYQNESYGVWNCGVRMSDVSLKDPPTVFLNTCEDAICMAEGVLWFDKMSTSIIEIVLSQLIVGRDDDDPLYRSSLVQAEQCSTPNRAFTKLNFPTYPIGRPPCHPIVDWYADADSILRVTRALYSDESGPLTLLEMRGQTEEAISAGLAKLPQSWFKK